MRKYRFRPYLNRDQYGNIAIFCSAACLYAVFFSNFTHKGTPENQAHLYALITTVLFYTAMSVAIRAVRRRAAK